MATNEPGDEDLLERVRRHDEEAARALFERYAAQLRAQASRGLPADLQAKLGASDVVQEALLSAFVSLGRFDPRDPEAFKRWLSRILGNRLRDEIRALTARKRDARSERPLASEPSKADPTPSVVMMREEERAALRRAVEGLGPDQRRVVELLHFEQVDPTETARRLGRSREAVRKLYSRALKTLATRLAPKPEGENDGRREP